MANLVVKRTDEVVWPFSGEPHYKIKRELSGYSRNVKIDPFPCIVHNLDLMRERIEFIEAAFPIGALKRWLVLPYEVTERVNAWASHDYIWSNGTDPEKDLAKKKNRLELFVVFSGKRSNIHPAMTRFLVAHEYGHWVDYWITSIMKEENYSNDEEIFRKKYAEIRGIPYVDDENYGGGNYHDSLAEIIADDFRIVVGGTDVDYYQHSCTHPLKDPNVVAYWGELREKYGFDKWWPEQEKTLDEAA